MPDTSFEPPLFQPRSGSLSRLYGVDAAAKICMALLYAVGLCQLSTPLAALFSCAASGLVLLFAMPVPRTFWRRLALINIFFLFLCVTLPLQFVESPYTVLRLGFVYLSKEAFATALVITLKGNAIGVFVLLLTGTSSLNDTIRALLRLRIPQKFVMLILLTHTNIQLLQREAAKLFLSARLRGFMPRMSITMLKTYAWLFGMVFVRAWQRSERVNTAMQLRGFSGFFPLLHSSAVPQASKLQWVALLGGTGLIIAFLWWIELRSSSIQVFL